MVGPTPCHDRPVPTGHMSGEPLKPTVRLEHYLIAIETGQTVHAMVEVEVPPSPVDSARAPLDLALVIDRSASMAGAKLAPTKHTAAFLVRRLSPDDRMAVVTYDRESTTAPPPRTASHRDQQRLQLILGRSRLVPRGKPAGLVEAGHETAHRCLVVKFQSTSGTSSSEARIRSKWRACGRLPPDG